MNFVVTLSFSGCVGSQYIYMSACHVAGTPAMVENADGDVGLPASLMKPFLST